MIAAELQRHPESPAPELRSIRAEVKRVSNEFAVRFVLEGEVERLRIPAPGGARRLDGLWQHTCFALFAAPPQLPSYQEFELSPSGDWAVYAFESYRRRAALPQLAPPQIAVERSGARLMLDARVELGQLAGVPELRLGVSAVVETLDGALSYWALRHPPGKPDFHHADTFALELRLP